ncbi:DUF4811 domain-containing protein [Lentilactobacillus sp. Marseille-Q4993]|uniref:DUF4811 domain-containing protein n=1 Tax=Lentilactobacillus sp. Marseille-Q4993 TaxID=3039492 RepID=UPI0024BC3321|nr:DUF4811 domain-containing protein [Lentilactobacillus sp. Marseille-Q4993]
MILWILGISTVCLYLSFILMKDSWLRYVLVIITGGVMLSSLGFIIVHDNQHVGMHKQTTERHYQVYPASGNKALSMMLYKQIGTSKDARVYIYKTNPKDKVTHTTANYDVKNTVKRVSSGSAELRVKKTVWVYNNGMIKSLFSGKENHKLIKQTNEFEIPNSWQVLSTDQAKALGKKLKAAAKQSPAQKAMLKQLVQKQVMAARMKNPKMTASQQKHLISQIKAKIQQEAIKKAIDEIK